jgi:hypothetical protein
MGHDKDHIIEEGGGGGGSGGEGGGGGVKYALVGERIGGWSSILKARCRKE